MNRRVNYNELSSGLLKRLVDLGMATKGGSLGDAILDLVNIRVSQLNGCAFCLDMHSKQAKLHGERELRLYHLPLWRESPLFSEKEKACLEWSEAVTQLNGHGIADEVFQRVSRHLTEKEISDLTFAIGVINFFNCLNISFPTPPGSLDEFLGIGKSGLI